jgi:hypothetical protein
MLVELSNLSPNARALYWFLIAHRDPVSGAYATIKTVATLSGIPLSSIYEVLRKYPDNFQGTKHLIWLPETMNIESVQHIQMLRNATENTEE